MKIKFYNGIKKIKNKVTLVKEKAIKKIKESATFQSLKKKSTKAIVGLAATAILITNLTGCQVSTNTKSIYPNSYNYDSSYSQTITETNPTGAVVSSQNYSLSYNRFLYETSDSLDTVYTVGSTNTSQISKSGDNADRRLATGAYEGTPIEVEDAAYEQFITMLDSKDVIYAYEEYFNIDEALNQTGAIITNVEHTHLIADINKQITLDQLVNVIIANNTAYLKENPEFTELPQADIEEFASYIIASLDSKYESLTDESKERIYCELGNLKVVGFDSSDVTLNPSGNLINAQYCSDGTVVIDQKQIATLPDEEARAKTYKHEIEHIYHRACEDQLHEGSEVVGISRFYDNLDVNPLFWRWHYEAAAESNVMTEYNTQDAVVYQNFVNYLRSLDLIVLINPNYDEQALELSSINQNPEDLFKIFGATTYEEKAEIIKMMYGIDYLQIHREDLDEEYNRQTGTSIGEPLQVKYELKNGICTTMAKYFYKNLAERIKNANVTLEDIFYLINVFESDLNTHINYDEAESRNRYFIDEYLSMQDNFFELLATDPNFTKEEIIELFNFYAMVTLDNGQYTRNASLLWLDENERTFIYNLLTNNITSFTSNIRTIYGNPNKELTKNR